MIIINDINNNNCPDDITDKKINSYNLDRANNFVTNGEITVTITLEEYRSLVIEYANKHSEIAKANSDKYERIKEIESLKNENADLRKKIYLYIEKFGKIDETTND